MQRLKKVCVLFTLLVLSFANSSNAYSASKSQKVTDAFETYLASVETTYDAEKLLAANQYEPQIRATQMKINDAKSKFLTANQVKVLKQGDSRNYWGNFDCPKTRPDCIYVDKGPLFQIGEITTFKSFITDKNEYLDEIDLILNLGLIEILNLTTYQEASKTIRSETLNLYSLNQQYKNAQNLITSKRDTGRNVESALLAAQRAAKSPSNYDKAFVAALKFEQNRVKLNELASTPWRYINSYKALSSAVSVTRLSDQADIVAENYSYSRAVGINSSCGTAFTNDSSFKSLFGLIATIYKQATKVSIKL
jgi:hypothetical protein